MPFDSRPRSRSRTRRIEIVAVAVAVAVAAQGCGSGSDSESSHTTGAVTPDAGAPKQAPAETKQSSVPPAAPVGDRAKTGGGGQRSAEDVSPQGSKKVGTETARTDASPSGTSCPPAYTRSQCAADAKSAERQTPSYPVSKPRNCLKAMSRADCKKLLEAQIAAEEANGESFRPEDCLKGHSRQECEAIFEAMGQQPK